MIEMFDEIYSIPPSGKKYCNCGVCNELNSYSEKVEIVNPERMECNSCVVEEIGYAQAYVPYQETTNIMCKETSLYNGTVFKELVQPYVKGSSLAMNRMERC